MNDEEKQTRILEMADEIGVAKTIAVLREWKCWDDVLDTMVAEAITEGLAHDKDEVEDLENKLTEARNAATVFADDAERLHIAICEGRRDDAIDILNEITGDRHRSIREQRNLFPDRIPA